MRLLLAGIAVGYGALAIGPRAGLSADDSQAEKLIAANPDAIAQREKAISEKAPKGAKLAAYLDCGTQRESANSGKVKIKCVSGRPYQFPNEAPGELSTQATIFFDSERVVFEISGLDRSRRYTAGLSWWDYDNGGRTQSVLVGSPDERLVRLAVPAIRLPNYKESKQLPAERRFHLPVVFSQDGKLRLVVELASGANAVISELWIWQLD
jgi:hypothetical protein